MNSFEFEDENLNEPGYWDTGWSEYEHQQSQEQVEELVYAARDYIVPSTNLRDATVELAKGSERVRHLAKRLSSFTLIALAMWCLSYPVMSTFSNNSPKTPTLPGVQALVDAAAKPDHWAVAEDQLAPGIESKKYLTGDSMHLGGSQKRLRTRSSVDK